MAFRCLHRFLWRVHRHWSAHTPASHAVRRGAMRPVPPKLLAPIGLAVRSTEYSKRNGITLRPWAWLHLTLFRTRSLNHPMYFNRTEMVSEHA